MLAPIESELIGKSDGVFLGVDPWKQYSMKARGVSRLSY